MSKTTKISLGVAAAALAGAMVSPQVGAHSKAERIADATAKKTEALEAQLKQMAVMMEAMQAELTRVKAQSAQAATANTAKVQELDQWVASIQNAPAQPLEKNHMFSARGGWMSMNQSRGSIAGVTNSGISDDILTSPTDEDAFYYGGAIDFTMNNDLFGLMDGVSFSLELGLEYSELGEKKDSGLDNVITTLTIGNTDLQQSVTVNMLRVSAAPKIKFMHGSKFRPWIIPAGIDINIISPPSDAVTVLNTGMQFGVGADYEFLPGIVIGADSRYHWTPDDVDGVDTDGFTLGGSVGFKF